MIKEQINQETNKKYIKQYKNFWVAVTLICIVIFATSSIIYYKMPKRECHIERNVEEVIVEGTVWWGGYRTAELKDIYIGDDDNYLCKGDCSITDYRKINSVLVRSIDKCSCYIERHIKVCEIK